MNEDANKTTDAAEDEVFTAEPCATASECMNDAALPVDDATANDADAWDEDGCDEQRGGGDASLLLLDKLSTLQHLLMRRRFAGKARMNGPAADPMRGQGRILALLKVKDGVSTKDMSNVLGIRTSSLNELLGKLERKGYIVREQSEEDKRVMVVKLTDEGRAVEQPSARGGAAGMFDCLSDDEKQAFGEYLDRVIAELEGEIGACGEGGVEAIHREREKAFRKFFGSEGRRGGEGFPPFGGFEATVRFNGFDGFGDERFGGRGDHGGHAGCGGRGNRGPAGRRGNRPDAE